MNMLGNLVFLSYRREDSAPYALALKMHLEQELRSIQIFMDVQSIVGGDHWERMISKALRLARVFIILIGPNWMLKSQAEESRLIDPDDWVGREVSFALKS